MFYVDTKENGTVKRVYFGRRKKAVEYYIWSKGKDVKGRHTYRIQGGSR